MILTILLGIDLFIAFATTLFIVLSIVMDLVNTNDPMYFNDETRNELKGHSGARFLSAFIACLCWTIFIMCA
jgi:hypothetical protein